MRLKFDNSFLRDLPADPNPDNTRRQVFEAGYSRVQPTPVAAPEVLAYSTEVAALLGLEEPVDQGLLARVMSGNEGLPGMDPWANCYGGHQFGNWAGQLGDGRAISLGEVVSPAGRWEVQIKGAGPTPYSRQGDGRAVLRSSLREFLCSEAMHHLGVPTTRALSLVRTGDDVVRDMLYSGNPRPEPGAIVCRVAPSFIRFGNFQLLAARRDQATLERLFDHTIARHFPEIAEASPDRATQAAALLVAVARNTAIMVAHWMRVGFVHGVMNTDNMSVLGLTIDYGPYGFLDNFDDGWTPNTTDSGGRRYRYGYQPNVAAWNLTRFAEALLPLVDEPAPLEEALGEFSETYNAAQTEMTAAKLGWEGYRGPADDTLLEEMIGVLQATETDMTIFFRQLARVPLHADATDSERVAPLKAAWYQPTELSDRYHQRLERWLTLYAARCREDSWDQDARRARMDATNPKYLLRNYIAQLAIDDAEAGDPTRIRTLLDVMRRPYDEQPEHEELYARRPEWARNKAGCSMLSCSS
ncbi:MAG: hypothetical protein ACI9WU_004393 [Myxococcota bacterium]|jgi:uncharacterized protein YdiU (UPF0061 family)